MALTLSRDRRGKEVKAVLRGCQSVKGLIGRGRIAPPLAVLLILLLPACSHSGSGGGEAWSGEAFLRTKFCSLSVAAERGAISHVKLMNLLSGSAVPAPVGFSLGLPGRALGWRSFRAVGARADDKRLVILFRHLEEGIEAEVAFEAAGDFWLRKRLRLRATKGKAIVESLCVAELEAGKEERLLPSGYGQPLVVKGAFYGIERPAWRWREEGKVLRATVLPGVKLGPKWWEAPPFVVGVSKPGEETRAFIRYLREIALPDKPFTLYNTWFDLRGSEVNEENALRKARIILKRFRKYGLKLDAVVLDDNWQDRSTLYEPVRAQFPSGLRELSRRLRAMGTSLGLWLPLPGGGLHTAKLAPKFGFLTIPDQNAFCLSDPKWREAIERRLKELIVEVGVTYFKHDFNNLRCGAKGHPHPPDPEAGFEANAERLAEILDFEHSLNPGVFLNVTSGMWPSPWWLLHANSIWIGRADFGWDRRVPAWEMRDRALTFRDGTVWMRAFKQKALFPTSRAMTHGIIDGRYCKLGGRDEPFDRWAGNVVVYLGRGVLMRELYITPEGLSERHWDFLCRALRWADENWPLLADADVFGGDPQKGEPYGHASLGEGRAIWVVRNPAPKMAVLALPSETRWARLSGGRLWYRQVFPRREEWGWLSEPQAVGLGPFEVACFEAEREAPPLPVPLRCPYELVEAARGAVSYRIWPERGEVRIFGLPEGAKVLVDGKDVRPGPEGEVVLPAEVRPLVRRYRAEVKGRRAALWVSLPKGEGEGGRGPIVGLLVRAGRGGLPKLASVEGWLDGKEAKPKVIRGEGWMFLLLSAPQRTGEVQIGAEFLPNPLSWGGAEVEAFLYGFRSARPHMLEIRHRSIRPPSPKAELPALPGAPVPFLYSLGKGRLTLAPKVREAVSVEELRKAKRAFLRMAVFGSEGGRWERKPVYVNGVLVGNLPLNDPPPNHDRWQVRALELPPEAIRALSLRNVVVIENPAGDCFKVADLQLLVELADGSWAASTVDKNVYCSVGDWLYSEGKIFEGGRSPKIQLQFRGRMAGREEKGGGERR